MRGPFFNAQSIQARESPSPDSSVASYWDARSIAAPRARSAELLDLFRGLPLTRRGGRLPGSGLPCRRRLALHDYLIDQHPVPFAEVTVRHRNARSDNIAGDGLARDVERADSRGDGEADGGASALGDRITSHLRRESRWIFHNGRRRAGILEHSASVSVAWSFRKAGAGEAFSEVKTYPPRERSLTIWM